MTDGPTVGNIMCSVLLMQLFLISHVYICIEVCTNCQSSSLRSCIDSMCSLICIWCTDTVKCKWDIIITQVAFDYLLQSSTSMHVLVIKATIASKD